MANALLIHTADNVAVVTQAIQAGNTIRYSFPEGEACVTAVDDIPIYHKVALRDIPVGGAVLKYGQPIGRAAKDIRIGEHVHCHNVESGEEKV